MQRNVFNIVDFGNIVEMFLHIKIYALSMNMLTLLSVDEILLPRYMNWSTNFIDLPFNEMAAPYYVMKRYKNDKDWFVKIPFKYKHPCLQCQSGNFCTPFCNCNKFVIRTCYFIRLCKWAV